MTNQLNVLIPTTLATAMLTLIQNPNQVLIARTILLGLAAWLAGQIVIVVFHYARLITRSKTRALPLHIVLIGISYLDLASLAAVDTAYNAIYGLPWTFRLPWKFFGYICGIFALQAMTVNLKRERSSTKDFENRFLVCCKCGSTHAAKYCCRCGTLQPGHENDGE